MQENPQIAQIKQRSVSEVSAHPSLVPGRGHRFFLTKLMTESTTFWDITPCR
jgi:hypothetical protein